MHQHSYVHQTHTLHRDTEAARQSRSAVVLALKYLAYDDVGNPQDQQDRDVRRNMKYERDTAVAELVLGVYMYASMHEHVSVCLCRCLCACVLA